MRVKKILYWIFAYIVLYVLLQYYYKFHFFWIEQTQLYQNTAPYVLEKIQRPGGVALVISGFLMQYFAYPFVGAAIISVLLIIPQKDVEFYKRLMKSYTIPEFLNGKVKSRGRKIAIKAMSDDFESVKWKIDK